MSLYMHRIPHGCAGLIANKRRSRFCIFSPVAQNSPKAPSLRPLLEPSSYPPMTPASQTSFFEDASTPPFFIPDEAFNDTTAFPSPSGMNIPIPPMPMPPPPITLFDEPRDRGRSLSRSPSLGPSRSPSGSFTPPPIRFREHDFLDRGRTPSSSRSPSRSRSPFGCRLRRPCWRNSRAPTVIECFPPPVSTTIPPPPPPIRCITPPYFPPPPVSWPPKIPVDILTFHFNKNMAYAPASKTYDVRFPPPSLSPSLLGESPLTLNFVGGDRCRAGALARIARCRSRSDQTARDGLGSARANSQDCVAGGPG
jgi:hypothetical protein